MNHRDGQVPAHFLGSNTAGQNVARQKKGHDLREYPWGRISAPGFWWSGEVGGQICLESLC